MLCPSNPSMLTDTAVGVEVGTNSTVMINADTTTLIREFLLRWLFGLLSRDSKRAVKLVSPISFPAKLGMDLKYISVV